MAELSSISFAEPELDLLGRTTADLLGRSMTTRRLDLCVRWPHEDGLQRFAYELKVRTDKKNPLGEGLDQLAEYLERLGLPHGTLFIFDQRMNALPFEERGEIQREIHEGFEIDIVWL